MIDKEIIRIASNTENHGALDNHTHFSKLKNSICGDDIKIYLIVENNKITNFKYECESCIYCQASVSLLSRKAKNKSIEKVKKNPIIKNKDLNLIYSVSATTRSPREGEEDGREYFFLTNEQFDNKIKENKFLE